MVNVPEGVPWDPPPPPPPPPQDASRMTAKLAPARAIILRGRRLPNISNTDNPNRATTVALTKMRSLPRGGKAAVERAVVFTVAWKVTAVEPTLSELGTLQVAAAGAPEQLSVTLPPPNPGPPIIRPYVAICPAETLAVEELPGAMVRPKGEMVPVNGTV